MAVRKVLTITLVINLLLALATGAVLATGPLNPLGGPVTQGVPAGTVFTYQGRLDQNGSPVNGNCDFQFRLFDAAGTQVGNMLSAGNLTVTNGLFTVPLDFGNGAFNGEQRFLEVAVRCPTGSGGFTTLSGRQELTPAPYAIYALNAWSLGGNSGVGTGENFLGTTDNRSLVLGTNGVGAVTVDEQGEVGIGTSAPSEQLEVIGNLALPQGDISVSGTVDGVDVSGLDAKVDDHIATDNDTDSTNELNTDVTLNGTTLEITDGGGTVSAELRGLLGPPGDAVAIELYRASGGFQYIVPPGKVLVLVHLMFNDIWKDSSDPDDSMFVWVQHSVNPSGPVYSTTLGPYGDSGFVTLFKPLIVPEGKAVAVPLRASSGGQYKVFLYGKLLDVGEPEPVAIHLDRGVGGTSYIVPEGKMLILDHLMFNDTWKDSSDPDDSRIVWVNHSFNPMGLPWRTTLGPYGGSGFVSLSEPIMVLEGKAVSIPFKSPGGQILHKVFLYGRLADAGEFPIK